MSKTATTTNGARTFILRAKLHPDPDQPRKEFGDLSELAESLAQRIEQNLIVRPHPKKPGDYLIVDGERRWRAAALKKIERLPVEIRKLTDEEAHRHQLIAGTQRANLSALEAADALWAQFRKANASHTTITFDSFAASLGIKRSTAYNRRALAKAPPNIRAALAAGKIDLAIATLVLTVQPAEKQAELLKEITDYPFSYRAVQEMIEEDYRVALVGAQFDIKKIYPDPGCVPQPCDLCTHRTGNMTEAHPELKASPNVCTLPTCFRAKTQAHTAAVLTQAKAEGRETISAELYARAGHTYQEAGDKCWDDPKGRTYGELAKKAGAKTLLTVDEDGKAIEVIPRATVAKIKKATNIKSSSYRRYGGPSPAEKAKREAESAALWAAVIDAGRARDWPKHPLTFWQKLAQTVIADHAYELDEKHFKGRSLPFADDGIKDVETLNRYTKSPQASELNLIGLIIQILLDGLVTPHHAGALEIWGVNWKTFLKQTPKPAGAKLKAAAAKSKPKRAATRKKGKKK